ncbi:hypothetical protein ADL25_30340 [Streptomyces sp. NRRL F-5122]|nr:hypothetical protein ADL25_30340 [Streptomyces sp. NRRL F-5122]
MTIQACAFRTAVTRPHLGSRYGPRCPAPAGCSRSIEFPSGLVLRSAGRLRLSTATLAPAPIVCTIG